MFLIKHENNRISCIIYIVQFAVGRVVREAPAATTADAWNDVVKSTRDTIDTLHTSLLKLSGVQSDEELLKKVQDQARDVGTELQAKVTELTSEVCVCVLIEFVEFVCFSSYLISIVHSVGPKELRQIRWCGQGYHRQIE